MKVGDEAVFGSISLQYDYSNLFAYLILSCKVIRIQEISIGALGLVFLGPGRSGAPSRFLSHFQSFKFTIGGPVIGYWCLKLGHVLSWKVWFKKINKINLCKMSLQLGLGLHVYCYCLIHRPTIIVIVHSNAILFGKQNQCFSSFRRESYTFWELNFIDNPDSSVSLILLLLV